MAVMEKEIAPAELQKNLDDTLYASEFWKRGLANLISEQGKRREDLTPAEYLEFAEQQDAVLDIPVQNYTTHLRVL